MTVNRSLAGWEVKLVSVTARLTVSIRLVMSRSWGRSSMSSPHRSPDSTAVSTISRAVGEGSAVWMASYWAGVTMILGLRPTVGVLMPAHGCRNTTWSFNAVVKIADRMVLFPAIVPADNPDAFCVRIQLRMCSGRMSIIRIEPNCGIRCLPIM